MRTDPLQGKERVYIPQWGGPDLRWALVKSILALGHLGPFGFVRAFSSYTMERPILYVYLTKIYMINELVKYQDHYAKVLKYQSQQNKPLSKKQQREFYMSVLKSHSGWKTKHFKGMKLEEIKEKFIPIWKQIEDFVPMASKEERERMKRKGLQEDLIQRWTLVKETLSIRQATSDKEKELWVELKRTHCPIKGVLSAKKIKTSEEVSEEDLKEMMQLVPVEERNYWKIIRLGGSTSVYQFFVYMLKHFDREDLIQLWTLVKETLSIRQATSDKEKELWVELKRLFEPNFEDQL
nr:hypothetical protein [Tanacetum cinerariifolium]